MLAAFSSYWEVFRLIFVIFSLYLMGDAFYRWDGFRYYASFSDFLPSVALITILWSSAALFFTAIIWISQQVILWFCHRIGWNVRMDHGLIFIIGSFVILGATTWIVKRYLAGGILIYTVGYTVVFLCITFLSILIWLFRNKSEQLMCTIQERISPLVWLFSVIVILSVPLVCYRTFWKKTDHVMLQKNALPYETKKNRPNIILVTFDALSERNMSIYGYHRETTPFISNWAKNASVFTKAKAGSNITTPTTASLMTGKRLWTHQTYHLNGSKPKRVNTENLPLLLQNYGYHTMAFVVNPFASVKALGIENNFDIAPFPTQFHGPVSLFGYFDKFLYQLFGDKIKLHDWIIQRDFIPYRLLIAIFDKHFTTAFPPENAFKKFLWVIDKSPQEPFFSWIHLYPPHDPYLPPKPFIGLFDFSPELRTATSHYKVKEIALRYRDTFQDFPPEVQPIINTLKNRYDEFIRYCDKQFEDFITLLSANNKLENTVIILSSDHGESFEHGAIQHSGLHLYEQVTNIPLIIKEPFQTEGRIINDLVEQTDIPAILNLANVPIPSWMEGRSLVPLMHGKRIPASPGFSMDFTSSASQEHQITKGTIAIWEGDYKLIYYLDKDKYLLFNLRQDPDEIQNLFDMEPETSQRLLNIIHNNLKKANEKISKGK